MVVRTDNHLIVGWQAVDKAVSAVSTAFAESIKMGATQENVAGTIWRILGDTMHI